MSAVDIPRVMCQGILQLFTGFSLNCVGSLYNCKGDQAAALMIPTLCPFGTKFACHHNSVVWWDKSQSPRLARGFDFGEGGTVRPVGRVLAIGGLGFGLMLAAMSSAWAACNLCVVNASTNVDNLSPAVIGAGALDTGISLGVGSTYVLTVQNPMTTKWSRDTTNLPAGTTADGDAGVAQFNNGAVSANRNALIGHIGAAASSYFSVTTMGALAVSGTVVNGFGVATAYTVGDGLKLAFADSDSNNNGGTQTVTITKAPTVGGNVLANVNVFAKENALLASGANNPLGAPAGAVATGLTLAADKTYQFAVTDPAHLWLTGPHDNANNIDRISTADGVAFYGLCTATCDGNASHYGAGETFGYYRGELVAIVAGKYYGIGSGRTLSGLAGAVSFILWDSNFSDNLGFMNVSVLEASVPEPGSLLLIGSGLAGLALLRRRRRA